VALSSVGLEVNALFTQYDRWEKDKPPGAPLPPAVQVLLGKATALCREALAIDPTNAHAH